MGDLPEAASYRLCVDEVCNTVEPGRIGDAGQYLSVAPPAATGGDVVVVDLRLLDARGAELAAFRGTGSKTGRCCPGVAFLVTGTGELAVEDPF